MESKIIKIIGAISIIIFIIIHSNNYYITFKTTKCVVLDKLTTTGEYRRSSRFYLVLKEQNNIVFDLAVSPATFSQTEKGDIKYFNLRKLDIKQTVYENIVYFFLYIIFGFISFVFLIYLLFK